MDEYPVRASRSRPEAHHADLEFLIGHLNPNDALPPVLLPFCLAIQEPS